MKKLLFSLLTSISLISFAQSPPEEISYQGVARNVSGSLLANQNIGIKLDLHQGSSGGTVVFSETHSKTTNSFGLFTLGIGSGNTAAFTAINWANGPYFLEVSMDPAGGSSYTSVGTQQFMSVPYALYAKTAGNAGPTYTAGTGINLSGNIISNTAPDQTVTITPAGSASVTGTYPNFTINTPTTQAYTAGNGIDITGGIISNTAAAVTPTITGSGATTVNGVYPNLTINTPTVAPDQVVTLLGTNAATVTGVYPNFTVDVPNGTLLPTGFIGQFLYNNGTIWDTLPRNNLFFDGTNFGIGTTSPAANFHVAGYGRFDASISTPRIYTDSIKITGNVAGLVLTSDANGNGSWQNVPASTSTITSTGIAVVTPTTGNNFNVSVPQPTLNYNSTGNILSLTHGGTNTTTVALTGTGSSTINMTGAGIASVSPTSGSAFTVTVPNPTISIASGSISISNGNSVAIPSPSLTVNSNSLTINGPGGNTVLLPAAVSQSLAVSGNSLSITGANTVILPASSTTTLTQGANVTILGSAPTYTVSAVTPTLNVVGGTLTGAYPTQTLTIPTNSTTNISQGTNVTVAGTAPNYTVSSVTPTLNVVGGTLTGTYPTQTLTVPTSSVVAGNANITVASAGNTYSVSAVTPTLNVVGGTIAGTYPTQTITISPATITGTGTGIATVTTSVNNFTVNVPSPTYAPASGVLSFGGTNTVVVSPSLTLTGSTLTSGAATNSVNLALLPGLWSASSTTAVVLTNTLNNVGIGTNNPASKYKLDVIATSGNSVTIHGFNTGSTDLFAGVFGENNNTGIGVYGQSNGGKGIFGKSTGGSGVGVYGESDAGFGGKFITTNTLTASNAVDIQTNGTGAALLVKSLNANRFAADIRGDVNINGRVLIDSVLSMSGYSITPQTANGGQGRIYYDKILNKFRVSENSGAYVNLIGGGSSPWIQGSGIITQTNLGDKVGIGTPAPEYILDVRNSSDVLVNLSSSATTQGTQAGLRLSMFDTYVGKQFTIAAEKSDATVNSGASDFVIKSHYSTAGGTLNNMVIKNQDLIFNESKTTGLAFGNVIIANGNLGAGTNFPSTKLDVKGKTKTDTIQIVMGANAGYVLTASDASGNASWQSPSGNGNWGLFGNAGTTPATNFIGTTDAQAFDIRTNNILRTRFTTKGQIETFNTGQSVFIGEEAGKNDDLTLNDNVFIGYQAGKANTTANANVFIGSGAGVATNTGNNNTGIGYQTLFTNTTGGNNTSIGLRTLYYNTTGSFNTANGFFALNGNTTGNFNTASGWNSLIANTAGTNNTASGAEAMISNTIGNYNTATGNEALKTNISGNNNTANGSGALYSNTTGNNNSAFGLQALYSNTGGGNTAQGFQSLYTNTAGSNNTALGFNADVLFNNLTKATAIGYNAKVGASNSLVLGGTGADAVKVGIGTTAPLQKLHITDITNGASLRLEGPNISGSALNSTIEFFETSAFKASMGWASQSSQQYWFVYEGNTTSLVSKGGNIGIGITSPTAKLHVNGTTRLVDGTQGVGKVLTSDASGNANWQDQSMKVVFLKDVKPDGIGGGAFTSGAWQTRTLNTIEGDGSLVNLASNQFTLQPGSYLIEASAPAYYVGRNLARLQNITDATTAIIGGTVFSLNTTGGEIGRSPIEGIIIITNPKVFEIQHRCSITNSGDGFGSFAGYGLNEIYTIVKITKIK